MRFNHEYEAACKAESKRLEIAEKFASVTKSSRAKQFDLGRADRLAGEPCKSANGAYVDGWYSVPNSRRSS